MLVIRRSVYGILSILLVVSGVFFGAVSLEAQVQTDSAPEAESAPALSRGLKNLSTGMVTAVPLSIKATHDPSTLTTDFPRGLLLGVKRGSARTAGGLLSLLPGLGPRLEISPLTNVSKSRHPRPGELQIDVTTKEPMPKIRTDNGFTHIRTWFSIPFGRRSN